jgi:hypothetical protein
LNPSEKHEVNANNQFLPRSLDWIPRSGHTYSPKFSALSDYKTIAIDEGELDEWRVTILQTRSYCWVSQRLHVGFPRLCDVQNESSNRATRAWGAGERIIQPLVLLQNSAPMG